MQDITRLTFYFNYASVAQLVVRNLAKVEVTGSNPVTRSIFLICKESFFLCILSIGVFMKIFLLLFFFLTSIAFSHGASKGDFNGTWRLVEYAIDEQYSDVPNPTPIKMYMNGEFIVIYYLENSMHFNKGSYTLNDGVMTETIESSSSESIVGDSYSYMPNFMGDKNSFYKKIDFTEYIQFERWERSSCDVIKCAKIRTRNN